MIVVKHFGKRRKCWLPALSLFPTMFSRGLYLREKLTARERVVTKKKRVTPLFSDAMLDWCETSLI